jgi:transcription initiation factor IIE alpha subunit
MGAVKNMMADVIELLETTDMSVEEIAEELLIDVEFVEDVLYDLGKEDYEPDVSEAQEWHDFDPEC